jgi:hypothetical protein
VPLALGVLGALAALALVIDGPGAGAGSGSQPPSDWDSEARQVLADVDFPVYAPEGLAVELGGWGGGDGEPVSSVSLVHESDTGEGPTLSMHSEFDGDTPEDDYAARAAEELEDAHSKIAAGTRWLLVDGVKRRFAFASADEEWVAMARVGDVTVQVQALGLSPEKVHLRALAKPGRGLRGVPAYRPLRPDLDVLDRRRVEELAEGTSLARVGAPLAEAARPALALLDSDEEEPIWFGGTPQIPADVSWPEGEHGAMLFVAQLSLADLDRQVWTGPASGHLHVFCDSDPESGAIEGPDACATLYSEPGAELRKRAFPSDLDEDKRLPRFAVKPQPGLSLPVAAVPLMRRLGIEFRADTEYDELWTLQRRLESEQGWHNAHGQVLGWDRVPGEDLMAIFASEADGRPEDWTLLLHTDVIDAYLYVAIPTADLAAGRFDRTQAGIFFD